MERMGLFEMCIRTALITTTVVATLVAINAAVGLLMLVVYVLVVP